MNTCQNCSKKLKISLINMGNVPVAILLLKKDQHSKTYPLEVFFLCKECKLYQLGKRLTPKKFSTIISIIPVILQHFCNTQRSL